MGKECQLMGKEWKQMPEFSFQLFHISSCEILHRLFGFSVPQYPHLYNGDAYENELTTHKSPGDLQTYSADLISVSRQQSSQHQENRLLTAGKSQLVTFQPPTKTHWESALAVRASALALSRPGTSAMHGHKKDWSETERRPGKREQWKQKMMLFHHDRVDCGSRMPCHNLKPYFQCYILSLTIYMTLKCYSLSAAVFTQPYT